MSITRRFIHAFHYMFENGNIAYWLGMAVLSFLLQELILGDVFSILSKIEHGIQVTQSEYNLLNANAINQKLIIFLIIDFVLLILMSARALDCAKRISEGDMDGSHYQPVARIGWINYLKYIAGAFVSTIIIILGWAVIGFAFGLLFPLIFGHSNPDNLFLMITIVVMMIIALLYSIYLLYAAIFTFIDTLSFRQMINPLCWHKKLRAVGRINIIKMLLFIFLLAFVASLIVGLVQVIFGQFSIVTRLVSTPFHSFVFMFGLVWLGFFATEGNDSLAQHDKASNTKSSFADILTRADHEYAQGNTKKAIDLLEPYINDEAKAVMFYPAYERLYQWYSEYNKETHYPAFQASVIHIAAQGNDNFYTLSRKALFDIAHADNTQIPIDDVLPLAQLALIHNEPNTVLALVKNFRNRQANHPDIVKVYACAMRALIKRGRKDIAKQLGEKTLTIYSEHPDSKQIRVLLEHL